MVKLNTCLIINGTSYHHKSLKITLRLLLIDIVFLIKYPMIVIIVSFINVLK